MSTYRQLILLGLVLSIGGCAQNSEPDRVRLDTEPSDAKSKLAGPEYAAVPEVAAVPATPPLAAAPTFVKNHEGLALVEALAEPPSFVNGSSIDIWIYREDAGSPEEEQPNTDAEAEADGDREAEPDADSEAVAEPEGDGDEEGDGHEDEDAGSEMDTATETSAEIDENPDADTDANPASAEADASPDSGVDADSNPLAGLDLRPPSVSEVAISGHAESRTCRMVTALVLNVMLQKTGESSDFFVAGAADLFNSFDPELDESLRELESVKKYAEAESTLRTELLILQFLMRFGGPSNGQSSLLEERKAKIEELKNLIKQLKEKSDVARYVKNRNSEDALNEFIAEARQVAAGSGLIRFHEVPTSTARAAREQVVELAKGNSAGVAGFRELLEAADIQEAIVYSPVLLLDTGEPLVITIDKAGISGEDFAEAVRENQSELEVAMIGDAKRRIERIEDLKKNMDEQEDYYRSMPRAEREQLMLKLDSKILPDVQTIKTRNGTTISAQDYLQHRIPSVKKWLDEEIARANELIETIHDDRNDEAGIIQETGVVTVVESMLRDWDLSVARSQLAFDRWKTAERQAVWNRIYDELEKQGVQKESLHGEDMVFQVTQADDTFEIRPLHMIDLARSLLVIQPELGCTQVESTWGQRQLRPKTTERQVTIANIWEEHDAATATGLLKQYLRTSPDEAIKLLEEHWHRSSEQIIAMSQDIEERVKPRIGWSNFFTELEALRSDPALQRDESADEPEKEFERELEYLKRLYYLLEKHAVAPVDCRLQLAVLLSGYVAMVENQLKQGDPAAVRQDQWSVLAAYARTNSYTDPYARANKLLNDVEEVGLPFDAGDVIRDTIKTCREREPSFLEYILTNKAFPEEGSNELQQALGTSEQEVTLFEMEALQLVQVRELLHKRVLLLDAAVELWLNRRRHLERTVRLLKEADYAGVTGRDNSAQAVLQSLETYLEGYTSPDSIARVGHAASLEQSAESNMRRAKGLLERKFSLPGHQQLASRIFYETGEYESAFGTLFAKYTTLAQYSPKLQWSDLVAEPQLGVIRALRVDGDEQELILSVKIEVEVQPEETDEPGTEAEPVAGSPEGENQEENEDEAASSRASDSDSNRKSAESDSESIEDRAPFSEQDSEADSDREPTEDRDPLSEDDSKAETAEGGPAEPNANEPAEDDGPFSEEPERDPPATTETEVKTVKLLSLKGLKGEELNRLRGHLKELDVEMLDRLGSARGQLLRAPLPLDGHRERLYQIVTEDEAKRLLVKVLAYGPSVPAESIVRKGGRHALEDDQRKIFDRTRSSSGMELHEPTLDELISTLRLRISGNTP